MTIMVQFKDFSAQYFFKTQQPQIQKNYVDLYFEDYILVKNGKISDVKGKVFKFYFKALQKKIITVEESEKFEKVLKLENNINSYKASVESQKLIADQDDDQKIEGMLEPLMVDELPKFERNTE